MIRTSIWTSLIALAVTSLPLGAAGADPAGPTSSAGSSRCNPGRSIRRWPSRSTSPSRSACVTSKSIPASPESRRQGQIRSGDDRGADPQGAREGQAGRRGDHRLRRDRHTRQGSRRPQALRLGQEDRHHHAGRRARSEGPADDRQVGRGVWHQCRHPRPSQAQPLLGPRLRLQRDQGPPARRLLPDVGHWKRSGLDPVAILKKYGEKVFSLHFKDLVAGGGSKGLHDAPGEPARTMPPKCFAC